MATKVHDHVVDEAGVARTEHNDRNSTERHLFHSIENIGKSAGSNEWRQRIVATIIAILICTALYGALYLSMHFQG